MMRVFALSLLIFIVTHSNTVMADSTGYWSVSAGSNYFLRIRLDTMRLASNTLIISNDGVWNKMLLDQRDKISEEGALIPVNESIWADIIVRGIPIKDQLLINLENESGKVIKMYEGDKTQITYSPIQQHHYSCEEKDLASYYDDSCDEYLSGNIKRLSIMVGID